MRGLILLPILLAACTSQAEIERVAKLKAEREAKVAALIAPLEGEKKTYVSECMRGGYASYTGCIDSWNRSGQQPCSSGPGLGTAIGAGAAAGAASAVVRGLLK
jgi:hypothetical protein